LKEFSTTNKKPFLSPFYREEVTVMLSDTKDVSPVKDQVLSPDSGEFPGDLRRFVQ